MATFATAPHALPAPSFVGRLGQWLLALVGAVGLTGVFFLILPLMQAIGHGPAPDSTLRSVDAASLPPPPPPPPPAEPEEEPEPKDEPKLEEPTQQLDLAQLELTLNPGVGGGWAPAEFAVQADKATSKKEVDTLFALADLDQEPRVVYYVNPTLDPVLRRKAPAKVFVVFAVDRNGRVENPIVQKSTDPAFEAPALAAIKKWRFEPGKRNGQAVRFRMRLPIVFPDK